MRFAEHPHTTGENGGTPLPLVSDLDGTLVKTDTLVEGLLALASRQPFKLLSIVGTGLLHGRAGLKARLAAISPLDPEILPYREDYVAWLRQQAADGRLLHLVSAADQSVVEAVGAHLGLFETCVGSGGEVNLKGRRKAEYLAERFPGGFSYAADAAADLAVWKAAKEIVLVGESGAVRRAAEKLGKPIAGYFGRKESFWRPLLKELRLHQWSKNLLVFLPLLLAHYFKHAEAWHATLLAFLGLGIVASGSYIINDLLDIAADRRHPTKCKRPLASGKLGIVTAIIAAALMLVGGLGVAALANAVTAFAVACYLALTLLYSCWLKKLALFDTATLGLLFTIRLLIGCAAASLYVSPWLLAFSFALFFSLSAAKRQTEIVRKARVATGAAVPGRGYDTNDASLTLAYGISSGVASLVILMLYMTNGVARELYAHPDWLWAIPLFMHLWQTRIWLLAHRGQLDDDPMIFALTDKTSLVLGAGCAIAFYLAL